MFTRRPYFLHKAIVLIENNFPIQNCLLYCKVFLDPLNSTLLTFRQEGRLFYRNWFNYLSKDKMFYVQMWGESLVLKEISIKA